MITPIDIHAVPAHRPVLPMGLIYAWLLAGTLDITAACVTTTLRGGSATGVLRAIASGVLGKTAFDGGAGVAALGLLLHFAIMFCIAAIFWVACQRNTWMANKPFIYGPIYGVLVYAVMNLVVLPLSAIAFTPRYNLFSLSVGIPTHMICVGLPIVWITSYYRRKS